MLFSTHTIPWVEQVCERVIVIHQGRLILDGTLDEMRQKVRPWARVEFHSDLPADKVLRALQIIPGVIFAENLTIGDETWLRYLAVRDTVDETREQVLAALAKMGGEANRMGVRDAAFEDLFATITRGSEQVVQR